MNKDPILSKYKYHEAYEEYLLSNLDLQTTGEEESLDEFFKGILPALEKFEIERMKMIDKQSMNFAARAIVAIPISLFLALYVSIGSGLMIALLLLLIFRFSPRPYLSKFKKDVIQLILGRLGVYANHESHFVPHGNYFVQSKIFEKTNHHGGKNLIVGKKGNLLFAVSEFTGYKVFGSGKRQRSKRIFEGIFLYAELPNIFDTESIIACKDFRFENKQKLPNGNFDTLHPEFSKLFNVVFTNYDETSHILSHELMDRLVAFKKIHRHPFLIKIQGDKVYMAINENKDFFSYDISHSPKDFVKFKLLYADCKFFADLVKSLEVLCE